MSINVFVNVGTRELIVDGAEPLRTEIRYGGKDLLDSFDSLAQKIAFPRIKASIDYILRKNDGRINRLVFIGTDQADESQKSRAADTLYYAKILTKLVRDVYADQISDICYELVGSDPPMDPHVYDETFDIYGKILHTYESPEVNECYLLPQGGLAACQTALLLQGVRVYGDRTQVLYHRQDDGETWPLRICQQFLEVMHESTAIDMLGRFDFPAALRLLRGSNQGDDLPQALLKYGSARLRFDFDEANDYLEDAITLSKGETRRELQEIRKEFLKLLEGDEQARIGELYHNARIAWDNGRYVSFLGRLIRFHGAVLIYLVNKVFDTEIAMLKDTFNSLAVRPELRHFVLDTLEYRAGLVVQPAIDAAKKAEELKKLRLILNEFFNRSELKDLCFDLGIDFDDLVGESKSDKARELIEYSMRHGFLAELVVACYERRPKAPWWEAYSAEDLDSAKFVTICTALRRIDRLVPLRNASIIGHGFRGVSDEIIMREYNNEPDDQMLSPVEDMAIICTALDISTVNPFRDIRDIILKKFGEVHTS